MSQNNSYKWHTLLEFTKENFAGDCLSIDVWLEKIQKHLAAKAVINNLPLSRMFQEIQKLHRRYYQGENKPANLHWFDVPRIRVEALGLGGAHVGAAMEQYNFLFERSIPAIIEDIVRSQAQSALLVIGKKYYRYSLHPLRIENDFPMVLKTCGKIAKGSYEDKTLSDQLFAFKIYYGNNVFCRFSLKEGTISFYQK